MHKFAPILIKPFGLIIIKSLESSCLTIQSSNSLFLVFKYLISLCFSPHLVILLFSPHFYFVYYASCNFLHFCTTTQNLKDLHKYLSVKVMDK